MKNTFVRSPHPTNKGARNRSCPALLSPTQLLRQLLSGRPTQRELGPAPPSFLHSLQRFALRLVFPASLVPGNFQNPSNNVTEAQEFSLSAWSRSHASVIRSPRVRSGRVEAEMLHLCTGGDGCSAHPRPSASDTPGCLLSIQTCKGSSLSMRNIFAPPLMVSGAWERGQVS